MSLPFDPPLEPMLAKPTPEIPTGDGWTYEPKWDGFRALAFRDGPSVFLQSRDRKPLNRYFPELDEPLLALGGSDARFVVDGEVVIARPGGGLALEAGAPLAPAAGLARVCFLSCAPLSEPSPPPYRVERMTPGPSPLIAPVC